MKISRNYLRQLIREAVEEEVAMVTGEEPVPDDMGTMPEAEPEVVEEPLPGEERASASISSLRGWLSDTLTSVNDLGIQDSQIPSLVAAMDDLVASAQAGVLTSTEDKVRKGIAQASGIDRSAE